MGTDSDTIHALEQLNAALKAAERWLFGKFKAGAVAAYVGLGEHGDLGYDKYNGSWALVLRRSDTVVPICNGPIAARVAAAHAIPELYDSLVAVAGERAVLVERAAAALMSFLSRSDDIT